MLNIDLARAECQTRSRNKRGCTYEAVIFPLLGEFLFYSLFLNYRLITLFLCKSLKLSYIILDFKISNPEAIFKLDISLVFDLSFFQKPSNT